MRWMGVLPAALIVVIVGTAPAIADGNSVTIRVKVTGADGKPVSDAHVRFQPFPSYDTGQGSGGGKTNQSGDFAADADALGSEYKPAVYTVTVYGDKGTSKKTIVYIGPNGNAPISIELGPKSYPPRRGFAYYHHDAIDAAEGGDKAGYQSNLDGAKKSLQYDEALLDEAKKAADAFVRDNNLQIKDHAGVVKALKLIEKTPENLRDKELQDTLTTLERILGGVEKFQSGVDGQRKQLADLEAKYGPKYGFLPSACPEGEGGGLLAGTLNSLFDTDLAASNCGEMETQGTHGKGENKPTNEHKRP